MNEELYYLGCRDLIASIFAMLRDKSQEEVLLFLATEYKNKFGNNIHIDEFLKKNK